MSGERRASSARWSKIRTAQQITAALNTKESKRKRRARAVLQHRFTQTIIVLFTLWALFGDDVRRAAMDQTRDLW